MQSPFLWHNEAVAGPDATLEQQYKRSATLNPVLNVLVTLDDFNSLQDTVKSSASRWENQRTLKQDDPARPGDASADLPKSPLDGALVLVKDDLNVAIKGWRTTAGSQLLAKSPLAAADGVSVARLREAGCVFLGRTTSCEFGYKETTSSILWGISRNALNPARTTGGSSGGSSSAVAAQFTHLSLGTDGAGSVRIPACSSLLFFFSFLLSLFMEG